MTNRLQNKLAECAHKKLLVPYLCAGDPSYHTSLKLMHTVVEAGADMIELGMPFSDPSADGIAIQHAHERALAAGMNLQQVLALVAEFREEDDTTPVILMGYYNPIFWTGEQNFISQLKSARVDGLLLVDLPFEEGEEFYQALRNQDIEPTYLIAPTTTNQRIYTMALHSQSFLYYVSVKGVTGSADLDVHSVRDNLQRIRQQTKLPVAVGFGIKDADSAAQVAEFAEAVVIGSAYAKLIEAHLLTKNDVEKTVLNFTQTIRQALNKIKD